MRLILLTLGTFAILGILILTIRLWGLGRTSERFDHPWQQLKTPWIVVPLSLESKAPSDAILWIDVLRSKEQNLYSLNEELDLSRLTWTDEELAKHATELKVILEKYKNRNLVLNIRSNVENIDLQISDLIGKTGEGRVLIQSDYDLVLQSIKKLQPLWLYGATTADKVRFRTFESIWVETATPFKGDVYIGPFQQKHVPLLTETIFQEIKRRGKKVIIGPLQSKEEIDLALRLGADGVFIDQAGLLRLP